MSTPRRAVRVIILIGAATAASFFFQFVSRIPSFTFVRHAFAFNPGGWLLTTGFAFVVLLGIWAALSAVLSKAWGLPFSEALDLDARTYLPVLVLALAPLSLVHYLTQDDLKLRMKLFLVAAAVAVLYLKIAQAVLLAREKEPPWLAWARNFFAWPRRRQIILLFAAAVLVYNGGSVLMLSHGASFSGDEPHYLLVTHSLLHDGDLDLANNYAERDYKLYLPPEATIQAHTLPGTKPGGQYSFHSPGVSVLLLPFYAAGQYLGRAGFILLVRFGMSLFGALLGVQMYLYALRKWNKAGVALLLWLLFGFTVPVFFYSIHVYPEIIVSLFAFYVYRKFRFSEKLGRPLLVLLGFLLSSFVWFHALKYFFILAPLFLYALWVLVRRHKARIDLLYFIVPAALTMALYFIFQYSVYGSLNPTSVSWQGAMDGQQTMSFVKQLLTGIPLRFRIDTLLGYFLDQRDGLLFYAPIYFLAFPGLIEIARRRRKELWLFLLIIVPYILVSAALTQRTGYAPQARPLVAVIWGPAILLGYFLAHNTKKLFALASNVAVGLSLLFVVLLCLRPTALYQETTVGTVERGGDLFYQLSHLHFYLTRLLPSFIKVPEWKWGPNFVWPVLILLLMVGYRYARPRRIRLRTSHGQALACGGLILFFAWFVFFPRTTLISERKVTVASGDTLTFFGLSRVAKGGEGGPFALLEDNRDYYFYFATGTPVSKLKVDYGSPAGDYRLKFRFFDQPVFEDVTEKTVRTRVLDSPLSYRWNGMNLYGVAIRLEKLSDVRTAVNPYVFGLQPAR